MIIKDGAKMSKSKGNVVAPDEIIEKTSLKYFEALTKLLPEGAKTEENLRKG